MTVLTWFTTKKTYLSPYMDDESAKKAATKLWNSIDNGDILLFGLMFLITILICIFYFFPFNKMPGRHYHPKWWAIFGIVSIIVSFAATYLGCNLIAKNPGFDCGFLIKVSAVNTLYSSLIYVIASAIINRTGKSNAYPYI